MVVSKLDAQRGRQRSMSPRSGRKKIGQGEVSAANGTLGTVIIIVQSPL